MGTIARANPALLVGILLSAACTDTEQAPPPDLPRAVTAVEQRVSNPARKLRIAGTAGAWKQEKLSFQVGGRVIWVIEPEKNVLGPSIDEKFQPGRDGTVVARIDPERYQSALDAARANRAAVEARLKSTRQQLEKVLPQELAKAEAELKRAGDNRDRVQRAVDRNAVAGTELTNVKAAYTTAKAAADGIRGQLEAKESELEGLQAQVAQATQAERSAELDLRDTELRAPFDGRITQLLVVPGALVQAGTPIGEIVMMDPIKVEVTVSARMERAIGDQDHGLLHAPGLEKPLVASFYQRDSVTDSATRTMNLALICRNPEVTGKTPGVPVIEDRMPLIQFPTGGGSRWFIERRCVHRDGEGTFAWRIEETAKRQIVGEVLNLSRMPVELGEARKDFVGLYQFHEIRLSKEMEALLNGVTGITVFKLLFALGVPEGFSGGKATMVRQAWALRPGDLVDVQLDLDAPSPGIYVPASAVSHAGAQAYVYTVRKGESGSILERVDVEISGRVGTSVRIGDSPVGGGGPVVDTGTHVLHAGSQVQMTEVRTQK